MKEHPILFNGPMVRAILAGTKTQTRRIVKLPAWFHEEHHRAGAFEIAASIECPHGVPGDRLWVRETHARRYFENGASAYRADYDAGRIGDLAPEPTWTPSILMFRRDSRTTLDITSARVERLHDITEVGATAEGARPFFETFASIGRDQRLTTGELAADAEHRAGFAVLWDEINGDRATWKSNPWVWVIGFKRSDVRNG